MKNNYYFDKTGLIMGLCVIVAGSFWHPLLIVLGSIMILFGILAYLVESYKAHKYLCDEMAEKAFFREVVQTASEVPIR